MEPLDAYGELIGHCLDAGYRFVTFSEVNGDQSPPSPWILLRHDVDLSPAYAAEVAAVNRARGVTGMFFLQLDADQYNLLDNTNQNHVRQILSQGQQIGLHYSAPPDEAGFSDFVRRLRVCFELLADYFDARTDVVAWHNPSIAGRSVLEKLNTLVEGKFPCATNPPFMGPEITYIADSQRRHTVSQLKALLNPEESPRVQLNLHPVYWVVPGAGMQEVFLRNLHNKITNTIAAYDSLEWWEQLRPELLDLIEPLKRGKHGRDDSK